MPARTSWRQALLLVAGGALVACIAVEVSVRAFTHTLWTSGGSEADDGVVTDPMQGRVIVKTGSARHRTKGFTMSIGEHGIRLNGDTAARSDHPLILAVGDSFAFGDGVGDENTWPAVLERLSGGKVINAGMVGFGLDQAVLRAERLVDTYSPDIVIVGFIPHDVLRCEMSYWSGFSKPYFDLDSATLRFHPAEIPTPSLFSSLKKALSSSITLDLLFPDTLHWQGPRELRVHHQGPEVACRLMERLAVLGQAHRMRIVVLAHPQEPTSRSEDVKLKDDVLACARANHLLVLDLFPVIDSLSQSQREPLFERHFTVAGYRLVGTELAKFIARQPPGDGMGAK